MTLVRRLGAPTATFLVVANMIGTGVFVTSGLALEKVPSTGVVLLAWVVGGLLALFGALAYAELGATVPGNGGEAHILTELVHPAAGFVAGAISFVFGFAAPSAAAALTFGKYLVRAVPALEALGDRAQNIAAVGLLVVSAALHARNVDDSAKALNYSTVLKLGLIVALLAASTFSPHAGTIELARATETTATGLGEALILVAYSYGGWNAATYIAGEMRDPGRTVPRAIVVGTLGVTALYVALNAVFLLGAPAADLAGRPEIAHFAMSAMFGEGAARAVSAVIAFGLVSTVGAFFVAAGRILDSLARTNPRLEPIARRSAHGGTGRAMLAILIISIPMAIKPTLGEILVYAQVPLSLGTMATAACVFVARRKHPESAFRSRAHPIGTGIFLALTGITTALAVAERPLALVGAIVIIVAAVAAYFWRPESGPSIPGVDDR